MFAPLYLSNYCINGCVYCPYHAINKTIPRKKLSQDEIRAEVEALVKMGHKRLALEAGEHPVMNPLEYILESIHTIYDTKVGNGEIRRVNVNIAATEVEAYEKLKAAGYKMNLHDFVALPDEMQALGLGTVYRDLHDACANARLLLVLNNHKKSRKIIILIYNINIIY